MRTSSSDIHQLSWSKSMPTVAESCDSAPQKDGFPDCMCGKGTSACSIHPNSRAEWIASMRDSLARISAQLEKGPGSTENEAGYFSRSSESLAYYDRDTFSWKTCQQSLFEGLDEFSGPWSKSGMIAGGQYYPLEMSGQITCENGGGALLPTPTVIDAKSRTYQVSRGKKFPTLAGVARGFWTQKLSGAKRVWKWTGGAVTDGGSATLLNPVWLEWIMGFPIKSTELKD